MKIAINLASQPYVELRPLYNRLRIWILILLLTGGALWFLYRNERIQADEASARVTNVENHVSNLEQLQQKYQTMMQQPKDAAILRQSDFLNGLFRRKAFSWTATMTDLETVLPSGVEVLSIDPIVATDGHVTIRLRVTGQRDRALDLIRNLERSRHFAAPRLTSESLATGPAGTQPGLQNVSTGNDVNFDILADYRPLLLPDQAGQEKENGTPARKAQPHAEHRSAKKPKAGMARRKSTP
ncbi:MAG TPA: fimbrial assembly protein [Acidobacteriaceae bacterium]|jgi:type IV pilus assembly protein PilN|nr:fimbrial assembly protein [Acidobacteriaceae bacterium]